jgi:recombination associated protein RdgC
MFKNILIYRIADGWKPTLKDIEEGLARVRFVSCGASQDKSFGWDSPRGEKHGALVESVAGQWMLRLKMETKILPTSVVNRRAEERADQIEESSGRKLGRMQRKELRENALLELLPKAFTKISSLAVWISPEQQLIVIDAGSQSVADEVVSLLINCLDDLAMVPLQTNMAPASTMAAWLMSFDIPGQFDLDRECELKATDETQATVRYARHNIVIDEVRKHIQNGKMPKQLGLTWAGRVSFVLNDALQIKKIKFLEGVIEKNESQDEGEDHFEADTAIVTGELSKMIPDLIEALGGELEN